MSEANDSLATMAIKNPMFRDAVKTALFTPLSNDDDQQDQEYSRDNQGYFSQRSTVPANNDPSALDVDEGELAELRKWSRGLRIGMIVCSVFMAVTSWYALVSTSATSISTLFISLYLFFFSGLICCFESGLPMVTQRIVMNFGFMYTAMGKLFFLLFVGFLAYGLSNLGIATFALIIVYLAAYLYAQFKHPQFAKYMRVMHAYNKAKAKRPSPRPKKVANTAENV